MAQLSAKACDDVTADDEAQTHAVRLAGDKWSEELLDKARIDTGTVIRNGDDNLFAALFSLENDGGIMSFLQRFHRILHQVDDHLFQTETVPDHIGNIGRIALQPHARLT